MASGTTSFHTAQDPYADDFDELSGYSVNNWGGIDPNDFDDFLGIRIGKKAKARGKVLREDRQANRKEKKALKRDAKRARTENLRSKAQSRTALAEQGIEQTTGIGSVVGGITSLASSLLGGGASQGGSEATGNVFSQPSPVRPQTMGEQVQTETEVSAANDNLDPQDPDPGTYTGGNQNQPNPDAPNKKSNSTIYIIIAAVLVVVVVIVMVGKHKK